MSFIKENLEFIFVLVQMCETDVMAIQPLGRKTGQVVIIRHGCTGLISEDYTSEMTSAFALLRIMRMWPAMTLLSLISLCGAQKKEIQETREQRGKMKNKIIFKELSQVKDGVIGLKRLNTTVLSCVMFFGVSLCIIVEKCNDCNVMCNSRRNSFASVQNSWADQDKNSKVQ